jgi:hypothetical protein
VSAEATIAVVLIGCAVGGTIGVAGVLVGLVVGRRLREMPRVKCVASDWDVTVYEGADPLGRAVCSFEVDLFNEGALATGLRGPSVALDGEDGARVAVVRLKDASSKQDLWALDLPPRKWAHASVYALLEGDEVQDALGFRRVHLVGEFPDGNAFEAKVIERGDFVATRKKAGDARRDTTSPVATFAPAFSSAEGPPGLANEAKATLASERVAWKRWVFGSKWINERWRAEAERR